MLRSTICTLLISAAMWQCADDETHPPLAIDNPGAGDVITGQGATGGSGIAGSSSFSGSSLGGTSSFGGTSSTFGGASSTFGGASSTFGGTASNPFSGATSF